MIVLKQKEDCCGCHGCESVCPKSCIAMREDAEGFFYPETDASLCVDCGLCEKVCPVINSPMRTGTSAKITTNFLKEPLVFAARCADDGLRMASASGGAFTVLAERVIKNGGVVFGARWNAGFTEVVHDFVETVEGLSAFRGSKYLQSRIGDSFKKAHAFLRAGREVMFSGTPCQIAGLKWFLRKDYPNLLAVDIACHNVASPKVWRTFWTHLRESKGLTQVTNILFRKKKFDQKRGAWNSATFSVEKASGEIHGESFSGTEFGKGFYGGLLARPSCCECPAKDRTSGSDITLGDFWGIEKYFPNLNAHEGLSVVICNTERGNAAVEANAPAFSVLQKATYDQAAGKNRGLRDDNPWSNPKREAFFADFNAAGTPAAAVAVIEKFTTVSFPTRIKDFIRKKLAAAGMLSLVRKILPKAE